MDSNSNKNKDDLLAEVRGLAAAMTAEERDQLEAYCRLLIAASEDGQRFVDNGGKIAGTH